MRKVQKRPKRWLVPGLFALIGLVAAAGVYVWLMATSTPENRPTPTANTSEPAPSTKLRIAMMGDMLAHDSIVSQARAGDSYDFAPYFNSVKPLYADADIVFCNAETPAAGDELGVSGYPAFNAPSKFVDGLVGGAGCNLINLATNHISDKGQAGIDATLAAWRKQPSVFAVAGANSSAEEQAKVSYFTVQGIRCAFLAFADFSNSPPPNTFSLNTYHDTALVERLMKEAREQAEFVIVSAHWGTEDATAVNADQRAAAQLFADNGAHLVIGTGPHVLQPYELVLSKPVEGTPARTVPVWYSIGNLLSSQLQLNELTGGVAYQVFEPGKEALWPTTTNFFPTFMSYDWPAADRATERLSTRSNLLLRPLKDAGGDITKMFPQASYDERLTFIKGTLGENVTVR